MTPLEAAKALAARPLPGRCWFCDEIPSIEGHGESCPFFVLPQIVVALEAAERLRHIDGVPEDEEPTARDPWADEYNYWFCNGYAPDHADDCPWQALVTALKGAEIDQQPPKI